MNANTKSLSITLKAVRNGKTVEVRHHGQTAFIRPDSGLAVVSDKRDSGGIICIDLNDDYEDAASWLADNGVKARY